MTGSISIVGKSGRRVARARGMALRTVKRQCPWAVRVVKVESVLLAFESYDDCPDYASTTDMRHISSPGAQYKGY